MHAASQYEMDQSNHFNYIGPGTWGKELSSSKPIFQVGGQISRSHQGGRVMH